MEGRRASVSCNCGSIGNAGNTPGIGVSVLTEWSKMVPLHFPVYAKMADPRTLEAKTLPMGLQKNGADRRRPGHKNRVEPGGGPTGHSYLLDTRSRAPWNGTSGDQEWKERRTQRCLQPRRRPRVVSPPLSGRWWVKRGLTHTPWGGKRKSKDC